MNTIKKNLVQVLERTQETEYLLSLIETNKRNIYSSMGVPSEIIGSTTSNSATTISKSPYLINIDVTKLP